MHILHLLKFFKSITFENQVVYVPIFMNPALKGLHQPSLLLQPLLRVVSFFSMQCKGYIFLSTTCGKLFEGLSLEFHLKFMQISPRFLEVYFISCCFMSGGMLASIQTILVRSFCIFTSINSLVGFGIYIIFSTSIVNDSSSHTP